MAFLGDFGKIFLGGATTGDVGGAVGGFFGAPELGRKAGQGLSALVSGTGDTLDRTSQTSGVDSAATVAPVSQTSQLQTPTGSQTSTAMTSPINQAFIGALPFGGAVAAGGQALARQLFKSPATSVATGLGAGAVVDFFVDQMGNTKKLVITRKMQRDVKKLFMMAGGDFNMTAQLYRMATGRSITGEQVVKIITKTFTNQGPYVTKAAVRKTRSTIRKMETLCELKDRIAPPKRRAPVRRRSATTITQVK